MSNLLLRLLISRCNLLSSLSTVNNSKCLKLSVLSLLIILFIVTIGNVYLLKRNRRCLILVNRVCFYVNVIGSNHTHTGLVLRKEKHNLFRSFRIGKRSGALCICRLSGSSYRSCLCGCFIFSLRGSSCGSCSLGRRYVFSLRNISLCSLDHDCGSLAVLITLSRLKCLKSQFFFRSSRKKCRCLLDTGIYGLFFYGSGSVVLGSSACIIASGSFFHVNRLGCSVGRLFLSSLSSLSLRLVIRKKRVSLCDAGIYPRILFRRSRRALIRRIIFGHGLGLSKICELLLCTDDSILFIVSGNVRHGSSIKACAEGDACTTHLCELIKLIHFAGLLLTRFCIGKGRRIALLVLLILLVFLALRRRSIGCIYRNGSSRRNSKGHSDRI